MVNTILKEADLFCPNSVRINFTIYHKANREFISHAPKNSEGDFSKMFTRSDDPNKPDAYDTIPDIKKYLDKHGIDYSHAKFKGDYVALIPDD